MRRASGEIEIIGYSEMTNFYRLYNDYFKKLPSEGIGKSVLSKRLLEKVLVNDVK